MPILLVGVVKNKHYLEDQPIYMQKIIGHWSVNITQPVRQDLQIQRFLKKAVEI